MNGEYALLERACHGRINPENLQYIRANWDLYSDAVRREYYDFIDAMRKLLAPKES